MTEPQEFSSDFDRWVCSLLGMLRTRYYNVSVNRGSKNYDFWMCKNKRNKRYLKRNTIPYTQLQTDFLNNQTPKQILELIK